MPTITITEVTRRDPYTDDFGPKQPYDLTWEEGGEALVGQLSKKPESPAPQVGERLDVTIREKGGRRYLKRVQGQPSSNGNSSGYGKSPQERAEIRRMWALGQANTLLGNELSSGLIPEEKIAGAKASELLVPRADWFEAQVKKAGES